MENAIAINALRFQLDFLPIRLVKELCKLEHLQRNSHNDPNTNLCPNSD
jgi:hypothetical protein